MDTCETCRWWGGRVVGRTYTPGECRRYPPIKFGLGPREQGRPFMDISDLCGEHRPKDHPHD